MARVAKHDTTDLRPMLASLQSNIEQLNATIKSLRDQLAKRDAEVAELRRLVFGQKRERQVMPTPERALRRNDDSPTRKLERQLAGKTKRKEHREERAELPVETVEHDLKDCAQCSSEKLEVIGSISNEEIEFVPAHFVRRRHVRRKKKCLACGHIGTAPGPERVVDGGHYGPGLYGYVAVSKCADAIPVYRLSKMLSRQGLELSRTTLNDIFHRTGELLTPVAKRILELIAQSSHVNADETPLAMQAPEKCKKGYIWTFLAEHQSLIGYVYGLSRSGQVPKDVLGGSAGTLQVDAYTGYNTVIVPDGRKRRGCLAHIRRYFFKAIGTAPEHANEALGRILDMYEVEYEAARQGVLGTAKHLAMRKTITKERMDQMKRWLDEIKQEHPPKSPMGVAIRYAIKNWGSLEPVTEDAKVRLDNNLAEGALRIIALGRKNFLFVGHEQAGRNLAALQTIVSTCIANDVNPQRYIADVLLKVDKTPVSRIDELLPAAWAKTTQVKTASSR